MVGHGLEDPMILVLAMTHGQRATATATATGILSLLWVRIHRMDCMSSHGVGRRKQGYILDNGLGMHSRSVLHIHRWIGT
jgi:hypothetical protein